MKKLTRRFLAQRRYRKSHRKQLLAASRVSARIRRDKSRKENPLEWLLYHANLRAKRRGIPFGITVDDIKQVSRCPVLKIELDYCSSKDGNGQTAPNAASLDRIVPTLGYVKGNVIIVSFRANALKRDASPEELKLLAEFYCK